MRPPARVTSIDLLRDWHAALAVFRTEVMDAIGSASLDVRRAFDWLEERQKHWARAIRERQDEVTVAKSELSRKQWVLASDRQPDVTEEIKALRRAQQRLAEAEEKLAATRRWSTALQKAVDEYEAPMRRLGDLAEGDLPKAGAQIENFIGDLEAYLALTPGSARPAQSTAVAPPPAPENQP